MKYPEHCRFMNEPGPTSYKVIVWDRNRKKWKTDKTGLNFTDADSLVCYYRYMMGCPARAIPEE